jgi:hypothetical protein
MRQDGELHLVRPDGTENNQAVCTAYSAMEE